MNRLPLVCGLAMFVLSELKGVPLLSAAQRALIGYALVWCLEQTWRGLVWPLLQNTEVAHRQSHVESSPEKKSDEPAQEGREIPNV